MQQALQGRLFDQRHVAIEDQHPFGGQRRQRLGDCVAGAELFALQDEIQILPRQALLDRFSTMADHHMDALGRQLPRGIDHMAEHGLAGNRMQDFGQGGTHAGALAGGEDDDIEGHGQDRSKKMRAKKKGSQGYPFTDLR